VLSAFILSGCAGQLVMPLQEVDKNAFEKKNQTAVVRYKSFPALIKWGVTGNAVVDWPEDLQKEYLDNDDNGKSKLPPYEVVLQRHGLPDNLGEVAHYFVDGLKKRAGLTQFTFIEPVMELPVSPHGDGYNHYKSTYKQPYLIEFHQEPSILAWAFNVQLFSPKTYNLAFIANAHIIRQSDSKEIWRGRCAVNGGSDERLVVSFDELVSKNNLHVKKVVDMGMRKCAEILIKQYYGSKNLI